MTLMHKPRSFRSKKDTSPLRTHLEVLTEKPDRPLEFWYIESHDRETLIKHIMPYMAGRLRQRYLLRAALDRHTWAGEFLRSEFEEAVKDECAWFRQTTTAFWVNPATTATVLLQLTRLWFFTLLRYTYRVRFSRGRAMARDELDWQHIHSNYGETCIEELTEDEIYRLTRLQNKYGASFYRSSYKSVKKHLCWTEYCKSIHSFCRSVGLHALSEDPEENLQKLLDSLTSIVLHQKVQCISGCLAQNTFLVHNIRKDVKKLVMSDNVRNTAALLTKHEVREMTQQLKGFLERDVEIRAELKELWAAGENRSKPIDHDSLRKNEIPRQLTSSDQSELKELRNELGRLHTRQAECITADTIVICRWLLEHLPTGNPKHDRMGYHWKLFWQNQWDQCRKNQWKTHPLWELVGHERYNKVGKCLYGTLSNLLHQYGHRRGDMLSSDVQRVVHVLKPLHFGKSGKINLEAERKRWFG